MQHAVLGLVSSQVVGKSQTLSYVKSCKCDGVSGNSSPQYWMNSYWIVCVVLVLDIWKYCTGKQGAAAQHLTLYICLIWLQWIRESVLPFVRENNRICQHLISFIYFVQLYKEDCAILKIHWTIRLALQSSSSNCLVLIPHRQLWNLGPHISRRLHDVFLYINVS